MQTAAAAGHADIQAYSAAFAVVASTAAVDARDNTASRFDAMSADKGPPIYWLAGSKAADEYEDFYDGSWDDEANATDESGSARTLEFSTNRPFTGSDRAGTESFTGGDSRALGAATVRVGRPNDGSQAVQSPLSSSISANGTDSRPFYALSPVFVVSSEVTVPPNWGLVPDGLGPGDTFRLLFATSTTRNGSSTDIADYNTHVQNAAAAGHADIQDYSSGFAVVASTAATDARDNTRTTYTDDDKGPPIYWLDGSQAADDYEDFYDGDWDDEANPKDESGSARTLNTQTTWPFTGSVHNGTEAFSGSNSRALGAATVRVGRPNSTGSGNGPLGGGASIGQPGDSRPLYALSPVFTVGSEVTVPSNWSLKPTGLTTGNSFRLLFATSTTRNGSSTNIGVYNTHVQNAAAAGHTDIQAYSSLFTVVASTAATDARDNTLTTYTDDDKGLPIYWLGGAKAADDYEDFYDGSWDDEANPKDESGSARSLSADADWPFTGSNEDGTESSRTLGESLVRVGQPGSTVSGRGPIDGNASRAGTQSRPFYALSPVFAVGSQVVATNSAPTFANPTEARSVAENSAASTNVGAVVTATDADNDPLTYTLEGTDAASFSIVSTSGQIQTESGVTYDHEAKSTYAVTVKADDMRGGSDTVAVTITVTDVAEPPDLPDAPTVSATSGSTTSLDVSWTAPDNTGPAITDYDVRYSVDGTLTWTDAGHTGTALSATLAGLAAGTTYLVRVRATNDEGTGAWSPAGTGTTGSPSTEVPADWSLIPTGLTSGDSFRLLFIPSTGTNASSSNIADYNSFVQTAAAAGHADIQAYSHTFRMVGSTESVDARDNTATTGTGVPIYWLNGAKVADDYADFYDGDWDEEATGRRGTGAAVTLGSSWELWTGSAQDGTALTAVDTTSRALGNAGNNWVGVGRPNNGSHGPIAGNTAVRTESKGVYALSGVFTVGAPVVVANNPPVFSDGASAARSVAENSAAGANIGAPVAATDLDTGDTLVYSLGSTVDDASFTIVTTSGQIQTISGETYDRETKDSYSVQVSVTDGTATVSIAVTITLTNVAEKPATPGAPTVTATENTSDSLDVSWTAPGRNGGPALTGYEVQYREGMGGPWSAWAPSGTGTTATIAPLDASTSYQVRVRALNGETPSDASPPGTGTTGVPALPGLSIADGSASEGAGTMAFAVTLSEAGSAQVTVAYATSGGSATQGMDYTAATGTLTFAPGDTAETISVPLTDDTLVEGDETFQVTLSAPQQATLADATATGTITDNDQASTALLLSLDPDRVTEGGGARSITVTVALDGAPRTTATQVTVSRTGGTATSGTDYAAVSDFTLTIPANQTSRMGTLTFRPIDDNVSEGDEEVELSASATGLSVGTAILTITDDDPLPTAIELSASPDRVTENGGARTVTVTAVLDRSTLPVSTSVLVTLSAGTATQGADYQAASPFNLSIPFGQASGTATFTFTPLDDSAEEGDETVILTGGASQEGLTPGTVTLTISDDESVPTGVLLSLSPDSVDEGAGRTSVTVTAALNRGIREAATPVRVTLKGASAAAGEDFQAVSPFTVTIPAGEPSATGSFTLRPVNDSIAEGTETLEAVGTASGLVEGRATLTIADDDEESETVILSVSPSSVSESTSARTVRVTATLDAGARPVPTNVVVTLNSQEAGFGPGQDAAVVEPFTITIEPGRTSASGSFTFRPRDDALAEGTESIEVRGEAVGLRVESATLELTDNDTATVNLSVPYRARHSEGGGATFVPVVGILNTVRSADTVVTVQVRGSGRSGVVGFEAVEPFELTIPAGERRGDEDGFMLYPQNDEEAEGDETLTISGRASGLRVTSATFLLEDDDSESASTKVTLELSETRLAESEGKHFDLTVTGTLDGAARQQDTVVTLEATNSSSDGSEVSALVDSGMRLTIRAGRISGQRTFGITLRTPGIDQADGELTLGGTADGLAVEPATLELLDGDDAPDLITLTLSETRVPEDWRGTVWVLAEMTPSARAEDTVVTLSVAGTGGSGSVGFQPVEPFELTIPKGYEAYGASFDLLTERDGQPRRDQTLTVSGTVAVAGLQVRSATLTLVDTDVAQALDFARFANGGSITSEMVLVNAAPHPIRPAIYFYDRGGRLIDPASVVDVTVDLEVTEDGSLTVRTEMEPLGELTISTHGRGELVSGSVKVLSDSPIGGGVRYSVPEIGVAEVGAGQPLRDALFPARRQAGGIRTAAALHNLGEEAMGVSCRLMSAGVSLEEVEIPLEANGQTSWFIEEAFTTTDTSDFLGSVRCTAPGRGRFTAIAVEMDAARRIFSTLSVVPVDRTGGGGGETVLDFAHFANGTWITDLVFLNLSIQPSRPAPTPFHTAILPSRPAIYFYDTEGNPIAAASVVDITGDLEITEDGALTVRTEMEPLGVLTISTHGRGALVSGSVRVVSEGPIGGMLRFDHPDLGVAGVGASPPVSDALFPVRRQEGGINTGVALHNLESSAGLVHCDLMREGVLLDGASIPLEANGQTAWLIDQAFPGTDTSDFAGSVRCSAPGGDLFTAVALEMDPGTRIFTTLPVVPVPERTDRE